MMNNVSVIIVFFLSGLSETKNQRHVLFFLTLLCYFAILLVNILVIVTIILDKNLHEPMYIFLCAFCINGLFGTAGFYPKFLWDLLAPVHVISYSGCLIQAHVMYTFACSDISFLSVMAYDRYVAICRPLQYHSVMSKQKVVKLVFFSWFTPFCVIGANILLASRLKLCSRFISRLFCVNWVIVSLACFPDDTIVNNIVAYMTILIYVSHVLCIIWSYIFVIIKCVHSIENRAKFMQTCVPHLLCLMIFIFTILLDIMLIRYGSQNTPQTFKNLVSVVFLIIPPLFNPLIYGLKLTKIRNRFLGYFNLRVK